MLYLKRLCSWFTVLDRYLLATISCYIRNKTILFVKIESWNFQNLRDFLISWNLTKFHLPYSREQKHVSVSNMGCQEIKVVRFLRCSGYLTNTSCVCQVAVISKRSNDKQKSFVPKKIWGMLVFETLKNKKSDFLNSNTCSYSRLYGTS